MHGGVGALKATIAPGPAAAKSAAALWVATPLLMEPVADRPNGTIAQLRAEEIERGVFVCSFSKPKPRLATSFCSLATKARR